MAASTGRRVLRLTSFLSCTCVLLGFAEPLTYLFSIVSALFAQKHREWIAIASRVPSSAQVLGSNFTSIPSLFFFTRCFITFVCLSYEKFPGMYTHPLLQASRAPVPRWDFASRQRAVVRPTNSPASFPCRRSYTSLRGRRVCASKPWS
jgi:hypothetical protein